ncbi:MAG: AbrB/MazE/SpoVT family DNA-binding domain-containing protein [Thermoanaerobaculia bacterium]
MKATTKMGKRGTLVLPAKIRRRLGLEEGTLVLIEETEEGASIRPAVALPVEIYSPERRAAFLLENAVDEEDYARARKEVRQLGLDPEEIPHERP